MFWAVCLPRKRSIRNTDRSGNAGRINSFNSRAEARFWPNGFSITMRLSVGSLSPTSPRRTLLKTVGGRAR